MASVAVSKVLKDTQACPEIGLCLLRHQVYLVFPGIRGISHVVYHRQTVLAHLVAMGTTVAEAVVPSEVLAEEEGLGNVRDLTELEGEEPVVPFEVLVEEEVLGKARGSDLVLGRAVVDAAEGEEVA